MLYYIFMKPEEMENQWYREDYLVAKGHVEVLILDKSVSNMFTISNHGGVCFTLQGHYKEYMYAEILIPILQYLGL